MAELANSRFNKTVFEGLRRPHHARPILGFETGPVLGFEKRAGFVADCCAPAMVCWLALSMA